MIVTINKKEYNFDNGLKLAEIVKQVPNIPEKGIAVAINGDVIPASEWRNKVVANGDKITIIKAFYGG